ncbi:hypothetical protein Val02_63930 [Virgisporangium aliadipatigenens]|uniref:DUF4247 domain-containing protein n=1 Tax=Virgisporangium aliadipatigenens TaxID=741659 RepID=A0A8J3YS65_9ACTN|nr:DUF4247 domain-containing protein [Virgisporangium aliadipatigenens]GIJ49507.1 hypothetical protein Val02_63930 [Virgisporangium aliadipatigenens]
MKRALTVVLVLVAFLAGGCGFTDDDVEDHVQGEYKRARSLDIAGGAVAYTSSKAPGPVEQAITKKWKASDRLSDAQGVLLRYPQHVVSLGPNGSGTVIRVEPIGTAYNRYRDRVGNRWAWGPTGENEHGGGPGEGK